MPSVSKPDATKFDNENDSIAESRAELHTLATSFNTIADEYNAGTLGGDSLTINEGRNIDIDPDSAGDTTINAYAPEHYFDRVYTSNTYGSENSNAGHTLTRSNFVFHGYNDSGSEKIMKVRLPLNHPDWKALPDNRQAGPEGYTSTQIYATIRNIDESDADIDFRIQVSISGDPDSAGQPIVDQWHEFQRFTLTPGTYKLLRCVVLMDNGSLYDTDSAGEIYAVCSVEDITTGSVRVRIPNH